MTHKERIDAVLAGKKADRVPFSLVDGGAWVTMHENTCYEELLSRADGGAKSIYEFAEKIDTDMISAVSGIFTLCLNAFGCPVNLNAVGSSVEISGCIKDPEEEIPKLDKSKIRETLLANKYVKEMINQTKNIKALTGDDKYLFADVAGPFTMAAIMFGTEEFMAFLFEDEDGLVEKLVDFTTGVCLEMLKLLSEAGNDIAFIAEPVSSGSMISQQMFEDFTLPALKNVREQATFCKYVFTHVCGASGMRTTDLKEIGMNAFSCDYLVDLDQALKDADGKMAIFGNINPAGTVLSGTAEETYAEIVERIKLAAGRPFILAPGCDLGANAPIENVLMFSKAVKDLA